MKNVRSEAWTLALRTSKKRQNVGDLRRCPCVGITKPDQLLDTLSFVKQTLYICARSAQ